ncbi:hypothetical protein KO489_05245 [Reinekea forsetii]|nr:hypothetical protein [Reinekea forsetii]
MKLNLLHPHWAACIALLGYGSWAALANSNYGLKVSLLAFSIQGSFAFVSTLFSGLVAIYIFQKLPFKPLKYAASLLITMTCLCAIPFILHRVAQTPNIFASMLPGIVIGTLYLSLLLKHTNLRV